MTQQNWSGWESQHPRKKPLGLIKVETCKSLNKTGVSTMSKDVSALDKLVKTKKNRFEQFKDDVDELVQSIRQKQEEKDINVVRLRGWQKFQRRTEPHYFLATDQENSDLVKSMIKNNIDDVEIRENVQAGESRLNIIRKTG